MSTTTSSPPTFNTIYAHLLTLPPPLLPPGKSHTPFLTPQIAALSLHPTLEAALHIFNHDLPSAHFLARHMQSAPAYEGMYLHGILHRIEGDYDNARAWYADVAQSDVYRKAWGAEKGEHKGIEFIGKIERLKKEGKGDQGALEEESLREIKAVVEWCIEKFGTGTVVDATSAPGAWVRPSEKIKKMGEDQVSGDAGARDF
ncbi:MAG: hypothetical protein M1835_004926 [Candelina submexicana]|nr:MAG: hypothetical protein M1835_004926 [Candelina submexicana]